MALIKAVKKAEQMVYYEETVMVARKEECWDEMKAG